MRERIARLVNGEFSRRDFAARLLGMGFGMMTAESILDTVTVANEKRNDASKNAEMFRAEPFSEITPYEQWMKSEGVPVHGGYYTSKLRALRSETRQTFGTEAPLFHLEGAEDNNGA